MSLSIKKPGNRLSRELRVEVECHACSRIPMDAPVFQCDSGHIICKDCRSVLEHCPTCNIPLGQTRNIIAERMLEKLPRPCQFAENGCRLEFDLISLAKHESICNFRRIQCVHLNCKEKVVFAGLLSHISKTHSDTISLSNMPSRVFPIKLGKDQFLASTGGAPTHLKYRDTNFFFEIGRNDVKGIWYFWVYVAASRAQATQFCFRIKISNPISNENILYAGSVVSTDIPKEEVKNSALSFELSDAAMIRMIVNNSIRCEVSVRSVEENPPNIFHCLWKFFSRK